MSATHFYSNFICLHHEIFHNYRGAFSYWQYPYTLDVFATSSVTINTPGAAFIFPVGFDLQIKQVQILFIFLQVLISSQAYVALTGKPAETLSWVTVNVLQTTLMGSNVTSPLAGITFMFLNDGVTMVFHLRR